MGMEPTLSEGSGVGFQESHQPGQERVRRSCPPPGPSTGGHEVQERPYDAGPGTQVPFSMQKAGEKQAIRLAGVDPGWAPCFAGLGSPSGVAKDTPCWGSHLFGPYPDTLTAGGGHRGPKPDKKEPLNRGFSRSGCLDWAYRKKTNLEDLVFLNPWWGA